MKELTQNEKALFLKHITKFQHHDSCWIWDGLPNSGGYGRIKIAGEMRFAHRIAYQFYFGEFEDSLFVCHSCDNPICVNPNHLFLGTAKDNRRDAQKKGRLPIGEKHFKHKLTSNEVQKIREDILLGVSESVLARQYSVSSSCIHGIGMRKTWKWLSK